MTNTKTRKERTTALVLGAVLSALVVVLQLLGAFVRFGPFSISLVLVPIVIGAATCGFGTGGWLGLVFGIAVLLSGDAALFFTISPFGTVITVLLKGLACGLAAGLVYELLAPKNKILAVFAAAIVCPIVNTGVFLSGCVVFFLEAVASWGVAEGFRNTAAYMFLGLAGGNFLFELLTNVVLAPVIVRVINFKHDK